METTRIELDSPIGAFDLEIGPGGIRELQFRDDRWTEGGARHLRASGNVPESAREIVARLTAYFAGDLEAIDAIPVEQPGTPFQQGVWAVLRRVGPGETVSYSELAKRAERPAAVRAVAQCNARNRIAIVVPCHRVIGADGTLTGYGGGLPRKRWLLHHEANAQGGRFTLR